MHKNIFIGCSSYNDSRWSGIFYPEQLPAAKRFEFYAMYFPTFEINSSFYKMPTLRNLDSWYTKSPENFFFSIKAPKTITHVKKFIDCEADVKEFYSVCENGLKEKLGCVLFQLPPSFSFSEERLGMIVHALNPKFQNTVEFRHESWWNPQTYKAFHDHGLTCCSVSYPKLPDSIVKTSETIYIRLHGDERLFYSGYGRERLYALWTKIHQLEFKNCFIYFNNTASIEGISDALQLRSFLKLEGEI